VGSRGPWLSSSKAHTATGSSCSSTSDAFCVPFHTCTVVTSKSFRVHRTAVKLQWQNHSPSFIMVACEMLVCKNSKSSTAAEQMWSFMMSTEPCEHTLSFLSASATIKRQSPSPHRLHVVMQPLNAFTPATGSAHASSHSCLAGSLTWLDWLLRSVLGRLGASRSTVALLSMVSTSVLLWLAWHASTQDQNACRTQKPG